MLLYQRALKQKCDGTSMVWCSHCICIGAWCSVHVLYANTNMSHRTQHSAPLFKKIKKLWIIIILIFCYYAQKVTSAFPCHSCFMQTNDFVISYTHAGVTLLLVNFAFAFPEITAEFRCNRTHSFFSRKSRVRYCSVFPGPHASFHITSFSYEICSASDKTCQCENP